MYQIQLTIIQKNSDRNRSKCDTTVSNGTILAAPGCAKIDGTVLVDGRRGAATKDTDDRFDNEEECGREEG